METDSHRVQFMSDLHLECDSSDRPFRIQHVVADTLVLAGDIGDPGSSRYLNFLADCAARFRTVLVVLGNHEAYTRSLPEALQAAQAAAAQPQCLGRVHVLQRQRYDLVQGRLRVLGVTLWSHVPPENAAQLTSYLADYHAIRRWTVETHNAEHAADVAWLRAELETAAAEGVGVLVVTHHAPSFQKTSAPQFDNSPSSVGFATNLEHMLRPPVRVWVHGHTHFCSQQTFSGCKLVSNQRGYPGEGTAFAEDASVALAVAKGRTAGCCIA
jgi:predicted phosphodiesterase